MGERPLKITISGMTLDSLVRTYGYPGLFLGTFFEGETVLIFGGLTAKLGYLKLPWVMFFALFRRLFRGPAIFLGWTP